MAIGKAVLVCGGRDFPNRHLVWQWLEAFHASGDGPIGHLIHGGARGVDAFAGEWATMEGIRASIYPADWRKHGRAAGPIRNREMLKRSKPDMVVAFPGGAGTADMVRCAEEAGVRVVRALP